MADWFGLGILGGVVTGYDGGFSPRLAAVPYVVLKNGRTSLKTYYVPAVGDVDADAIGFALRFDMGGWFLKYKAHHLSLFLISLKICAICRTSLLTHHYSSLYLPLKVER